jgi:hypothetical protein
MISVGTLAKTYGVLPSYVRDNASTFDLMIMDVMVTWEQHRQDQADGKLSAPELSQDELLKILKETKGE